ERAPPCAELGQGGVDRRGEALAPGRGQGRERGLGLGVEGLELEHVEHVDPASREVAEDQGRRTSTMTSHTGDGPQQVVQRPPTSQLVSATNPGNGAPPASRASARATEVPATSTAHQPAATASRSSTSAARSSASRTWSNRPTNTSS